MERVLLIHEIYELLDLAAAQSIVVNTKSKNLNLKSYKLKYSDIFIKFD